MEIQVKSGFEAEGYWFIPAIDERGEIMGIQKRMSRRRILSISLLDISSITYDLY